MRRLIITFLICIAAVSATAQDYRYWIGGNGGMTFPLGDRSPADGGLAFDNHARYGGLLGLRVGEGWLFGFEAGYTSLKSNDPLNATLLGATDINFKAVRIGGTLHRLIFPSFNRFNVGLGWGGGMMVWKVTDNTGAVLRVAGDVGQPEEFKASELFVSSALSLHVRLARPVSLRLSGSVDYLTGAGTSFASEVNDARPRWLANAGASLNFLFGSVQRTERWTSDSAWQADRPVRTASSKLAGVDSDADGVADETDKCFGTPRGVEVDRFGCPMDTDVDGVADGLDDCPRTPPAARGRVDVYGCPVDADFDGVADYLDACPNNAVGAQVDEKGCPIDSDGDGVADGLDDCPNTLPGISVDKYGCMDVTMFSKAMILRPDYEPGSFEIDGKTKARIEQLARALNLLPEIRLEINGYTDDIGNDAANQALSERRANRIRDYLVVYGVGKDRITSAGRGESNFVASNQTAEGRAKNRRIEILFQK